ncbi:MAG: exo-alpha-sialidase [Phycisphaerae bacterium]|nr:exo-alpha-sialidase [Phycisphaerae bacterium]
MNIRKLFIAVFALILFISVSANASVVAFWPLDDASGQVVSDVSGNGNHGFLGTNNIDNTNDPIWVNDPVRGAVMQLAGDGDPQWVNLDANIANFSSLESGTISVWIKMDGGEGVDTIFAMSDASDGSSESRFAYEGTLFYDIREANASPVGESGNVTAGSDVIDNKWHHVAVTVTADSLCVIYVDGQMKETGSEPFFAAVKDIDTMSIGRNVDSAGTQWHFKGQMSQIAIFDNALAADQILAIANGTDVMDVVKLAHTPTPADNSSHRDVNMQLTWQGADNIETPRYNLYHSKTEQMPEIPTVANIPIQSYTATNLDVATTYYWRIDVIEGVNTYTGPVWSFSTAGKASQPSPTDMQRDVYTETNLTWQGDDSIAKYKLYMGTAENEMQFKSTLTETSYQCQDLLGSETYYWRVDTYGHNNQLLAIGDTWSFSTAIIGSLLEQVDVFVSGTEGYNTFRIPVIMRTMEGTILAFCEGRKNSSADHGDIDLVMKRSNDGGKTWAALEMIYEEGDTANVTIGNPCPVQDKSNGRIWMPFNRDNDDVLIMYSDDDGQTWSNPVDITADVKDSGWGWYACGPAIGIQLEKSPYAGRLVIPCDHRGSDGFGSHTIYSDDHGVTWKHSEAIYPGCNECQAVELADGTVMMNMRSYTPRGYRAVATSDDGGHSWSEIYHDQQLREPTCQGSIMRYTLESKQDRNRILFCNPNSGSRVNMTVKLSYDEGQTWPVAKTVYIPSSAYSCLTDLGDELIGCLYERDGYQKITLARLSLEWLTDGADTIVVCDPLLQADFDGDCVVDLADFIVFASSWLQCNLEPSEACVQ